VNLLRPRPVRLLLVLVGLALAASACGTEAQAVAIADQSLTRSELDDILVSEFGETETGNQSTANASQWLSQYIFAEAVAAELADRGFPVTDEAVQAAAEDPAVAAGADLDDPADAYAARVAAISATFDEWLQAELAGLPVDGDVDVEVPEFLCSSHILVGSESEAVVVVERLEAGEDFATLAAEVSTGPSGPNGGDLGCVATAGFVVEFVEGARAVAAPGISDPVESQFGWHVIEVRSLGPLSAENHPEMDPATIDQELAAAQATLQAGDADALVVEIQDAALARIADDLELDARYGEWDDALGVVPPDGVTTGSPAPVDPLDG
jgi:parvulin-like peptidyl-prolyl isomerase